MTRATKGDAPLQPPELNDRQLAAVNALVSGSSDRKAADVAGVHRVTVSKWRLYNPMFRAALNERRADLWSSNLDRLRCLVSKALDRIEAELEKEDGGDWRAAAKLLELAGASDHVPVDPLSTPITPAGVLNAEIVRRSASPPEVSWLDAVDVRPDGELRHELLQDWERQGGFETT